MLKKREKEKEKERKKIKIRAKHRREESTRIPAATQWWSINVEHCGRIKRIVKVKLKTPHRSSWVTVMSGGGAEGEAPSGASSLPAFSLPVSLSLKRSNETLENHATTQRSPNTILHINITILVYLFFSPSKKKCFSFPKKKKKTRATIKNKFSRYDRTKFDRNLLVLFQMFFQSITVPFHPSNFPKLSL